MGGNFIVEFIDNWKSVVKNKKKEGFKIIHLSMYGEKTMIFKKNYV